MIDDSISILEKEEEIRKYKKHLILVQNERLCLNVRMIKAEKNINIGFGFIDGSSDINLIKTLQENRSLESKKLFPFNLFGYYDSSIKKQTLYWFPTFVYPSDPNLVSLDITSNSSI